MCCASFAPGDTRRRGKVYDYSDCIQSCYNRLLFVRRQCGLDTTSRCRMTAFKYLCSQQQKLPVESMHVLQLPPDSVHINVTGHQFTQSNINVAAPRSDSKRVVLFEINATRPLAMPAKSNSSDVFGRCSLGWRSITRLHPL